MVSGENSNVVLITNTAFTSCFFKYVVYNNETSLFKLLRKYLILTPDYFKC